jgi:hypothetical protein
MNCFSFFCPIFLGHPEASGFCSQSERLLYGRELNGTFGAVSEDLLGGTGKAEDAKLPGAGVIPKQWPKKMSGRKRVACRTQKDPGGTVPDGRKSDGRFEDTCFFKSLVPVASK